MAEQDDQFQHWLIEMDDAIARFLATLPEDDARKLDFSAASLKAIEALALQAYAGIDALKKPSESKTVDGMARYVGETFRRHLGGKWFIDFTDKKNAFYGLPQLKEMRGQTTQICPMTLVSASTDRRKGDFIHTVFQNIEKRSMN
jgi:hypothetical protein